MNESMYIFPIEHLGDFLACHSLVFRDVVNPQHLR